MKAGQLDRQISIYRKSVTKDSSYNTEIIEWVPLAPLPGSPVIAEKFWASVQDELPSRAESVKNDLHLGKLKTRIRLRYRSDIDMTMRVVVHGDVDITFQIIAGPVIVTSEGRKNMIEIMCEHSTTLGNSQ